MNLLIRPLSIWSQTKVGSSMGKIRIIGGKHRSRILSFPDATDGLRPTPDRVRETLFNWLNQDLTGKKCLDLFAGSGALAFEAASRGASLAVAVELRPQVAKKLTENKRLLGLDNLQVICGNGLQYLFKTSESFDIIFLDAPYSSDLLLEALKILYNKNLLNKDLVIYIEYAEKPDLSGYTVLKQSKAGQVNYALLQILREE